MKFKGDIIITDPAYIIKDDTDDWIKCCTAIALMDMKII